MANKTTSLADAFYSILKRHARQSATQVDEAISKLPKGVALKSYADELTKHAEQYNWAVVPDSLDVQSSLRDMHKAGADAAVIKVGTVADPEKMTAVADEDAIDYASERSAELVGMKRLAGELVPNPDVKWRIDETTRASLKQLVQKSLDEGDGPAELRQKILNATTFSKARASMIARTELSRAHASGQMNAFRRSGVVHQKKWLHAGSDEEEDCEICNQNEDEGAIPLDQMFESGDDAPPAHPNCFPANVLVLAKDIVALSKRLYEGPLVSFGYAGGEYLTVTPNHPILTNRGWLPASSLVEGDKIVYNALSKTEDAVVEYDVRMPAPIGDVFTEFSQRKGLVREVKLTDLDRLDFHGDQSVDGECSIVLVNSSQWQDVQRIISSEQTASDPMPELSRIVGAPAASTLNSLSPSFNERGLAGSLLACQFPVPDTDAVGEQDLVHNGRCDIEPSLNDDPSHPTDVQSDYRMLDVEWVLFNKERICRLHVYNLQVDDHWYLANHIIVHNCTCSVTPITDPVAAGRKDALADAPVILPAPIIDEHPAEEVSQQAMHALAREQAVAASLSKDDLTKAREIALWRKMSKFKQDPYSPLSAKILAADPDYAAITAKYGLSDEDSYTAAKYLTVSLTEDWTVSAESTGAAILRYGVAKMRMLDTTASDDAMTSMLNEMKSAMRLSVGFKNPLENLTQDEFSVIAKSTASSMYQTTQDFLKEQGIRSMPLFRGMSGIDTTSTYAVDEAAINGKAKAGALTAKDAARIVMNCKMPSISSYSIDPSVAYAFADDDAAAVLVQNVPATDIFLLSQQGAGNDMEKEVIVIAHDTPQIVVSPRAMRLLSDPNNFVSSHDEIARYVSEDVRNDYTDALEQHFFEKLSSEASAAQQAVNVPVINEALTEGANALEELAEQRAVDGVPSQEDLSLLHEKALTDVLQKQTPQEFYSAVSDALHSDPDFQAVMRRYNDTPEQFASMIRRISPQNIIEQWAASSDSDGAKILQYGIAKLGLSDAKLTDIEMDALFKSSASAAFLPANYLSSAGIADRAEYDQLTTAIARSIYHTTQTFLKAQNIQQLTLYRGVLDVGDAAKIVDSAETSNIATYTAHLEDAVKFAKTGKQGGIMIRQISAADVLIPLDQNLVIITKDAPRLLINAGKLDAADVHAAIQQAVDDDTTQLFQDRLESFYKSKLPATDPAAVSNAPADVLDDKPLASMPPPLPPTEDSIASTIQAVTGNCAKLTPTGILKLASNLTIKVLKKADDCPVIQDARTAFFDNVAQRLAASPQALAVARTLFPDAADDATALNVFARSVVTRVLSGDESVYEKGMAGLYKDAVSINHGTLLDQHQAFWSEFIEGAKTQSKSLWAGFLTKANAVKPGAYVKTLVPAFQAVAKALQDETMLSLEAMPGKTMPVFRVIDKAAAITKTDMYSLHTSIISQFTADRAFALAEAAKTDKAVLMVQVPKDRVLLSGRFGAGNPAHDAVYVVGSASNNDYAVLDASTAEETAAKTIDQADKLIEPVVPEQLTPPAPLASMPADQATATSTVADEQLMQDIERRIPSEKDLSGNINLAARKKIAKMPDRAAYSDLVADALLQNDEYKAISGRLVFSPEQLDSKSGIRRNVTYLISRWTDSSNSDGASFLRLGMHEADLSKLSDATRAMSSEYLSQYESLLQLKSGTTSKEDMLALSKLYAKTMYDTTQAELKKADVKYVTGFRGLQVKETHQAHMPYVKSKDLKLSDTAAVGELDDELSLLSWTVKPHAAYLFAKPSNPDAVIAVTNIPARDIFLTSQQGAGYEGEDEFIAIPPHAPVVLISPNNLNRYLYPSGKSSVQHSNDSANASIRTAITPEVRDALKQALHKKFNVTAPQQPAVQDIAQAASVASAASADSDQLAQDIEQRIPSEKDLSDNANLAVRKKIEGTPDGAAYSDLVADALLQNDEYKAISGRLAFSPEQLDSKAGIRRNVTYLISSWTDSSDSEGASFLRLGMHEAGLSKLSDATRARFSEYLSQYESLLQLKSDTTSKEDMLALSKLYAKTMYDTTQAELKKADIKYVTGLRGLKVKETHQAHMPYVKDKDLTLSDTAAVGELDDSMSLLSWTVRPRAAYIFAKPSNPDAVIAVTNIPARDIFLTSQQGAGYKVEAEIVVVPPHAPVVLISPNNLARYLNLPTDINVQYIDSDANASIRAAITPEVRDALKQALRKKFRAGTPEQHSIQDVLTIARPPVQLTPLTKDDIKPASVKATVQKVSVQAMDAGSSLIKARGSAKHSPQADFINALRASLMDDAAVQLVLDVEYPGFSNEAQILQLISDMHAHTAFGRTSQMYRRVSTAVLAGFPPASGYAAIGKAIYDQTQAYLAKENIASLPVYKMIRLTPASDMQSDIGTTVNCTIKTDDLLMFTADPFTVAIDASRQQDSFVFGGRTPSASVFWINRFGAGALHSAAVVLMHSHAKGTLLTTSRAGKTMLQIANTPQFLKSFVGQLAARGAEIFLEGLPEDALQSTASEGRVPQHAHPSVEVIKQS